MTFAAPSIDGEMVSYLVAIEVARVRFPVDAILLLTLPPAKLDALVMT